MLDGVAKNGVDACEDLVFALPAIAGDDKAHTEHDEQGFYPILRSLAITGSRFFS